MKKILVTILLIAGFTYSLFSQDTLKMMVYNVLAYSPSNPANTANFKKIFNYYRPDILVVVEINNVTECNHILTYVINQGGANNYARAQYINGPDSDNMVFFNLQKVNLKSQDTIQTSLRNISRYRLYVNTTTTDTTYLDLYAAHLKAGGTGSNELDRYRESKKFKNYITAQTSGENIIFCGDFNLYHGDEPAYKLLLDSGTIRMKDPLNMRGYWNGNATYDLIHSQSTRTRAFGGGATGGMDSRFDFQLVTNDILTGTNGAKYVPGTYLALGNDGNHFNDSLTRLPLSPTVPDSVTYALYYQSDHIPVVMKIAITTTTGMGYLDFDNFPSSGTAGVAVAPFTVTACKPDQTVNTSFTGNITLTKYTGPGNVSGTTVKTAVAGIAAFSDIQFSQAGDYRLISASPGVLNDTSGIISIAAPSQPVMTEMVVPRYMGSKTAASTNNARTPFAVCVSFSSLTANTTYNIRAGLGLLSDATNIYGAGNVWTGTEFASNPILNAFTTNGSGESGPVWVFFQPTGNSTRFDAGQVHQVRLSVYTGTTSPGSPMFIGSKTITALDIATTPRTTSTLDDGAFVKGSANILTSGKYVLLFDNEGGTGDPLFCYQIRTATPTNPTQSQLPVSINDVYMQTGSSAVGDYPAVVPIGQNNPNGIRRIEARNAGNEISGCASDADGIWPSGANTTNLIRRGVASITATDAPLSACNHELTLKFFIEGLYAGNGTMNKAQDENGDKFSGCVADTFSLELRHYSSPYNKIHQISGISLNVNGVAAVGLPHALTADYYLVVRHRNGIETWSSLPVPFAPLSISYDFTPLSSRAYGDNMTPVSAGTYAFFSGDENQDGVVDTNDMGDVDNDSGAFLMGYLATDINGDGVIDTNDMAIVDNNANMFIGVMSP
ncbi:MAG: hypothetical protein FJY10_04200 [Bacteroidetes bacterium]|nr:hypothetical protein [Bacteroidota bacterium]